MKIFDSFLIFAQNIDCGNALEPPRYIKVGCKGVFATRTCFRDEGGGGGGGGGGGIREVGGKPPDHQQAEPGSLIPAMSQAQTHSGEMIERRRLFVTTNLDHLASEAALC